jgi:uncharacterized protein
MLKDTLTADIKTAMLGGDKVKAEVLKSLKSAILYEEVAQKVREEGLNDTQIQQVLAREAKKRAESAELYQKAGHADRAATELQEKEIIDGYLPTQLNDDELNQIVQEVVKTMDNPQMGQVIGAVKAKVGQSADGARVAGAVKAILGQS